MTGSTIPGERTVGSRPTGGNSSKERLKKVIILALQGWSPGLVVMRGDSRSKGRGFESQCRILDGHDFFTLICCKNCIVCLEKTKINKIEAGVGPFLFKK